MRLSHPDYIKLLIGTYKKKRDNGTLSRLLVTPTPANIKKACQHVYKQRFRKEDEQALTDFFGPTEFGRQFLQSIENFETSRFKPLSNYLKGETENTDNVNVELFAWLMDFRFRPCVYGKEVILTEEELSILNDKENNEEPEFIDEEPGNDDLASPGEENEEKKKEPIEVVKSADPNETLPEPSPEPEKPTKSGDETGKIPDEKKQDKYSETKGISKAEKALLYFLLFIISIGSAYTLWQQKQDNQMMALGNPNTGCMYWTGDHYDTVSCADRNSNRLKLPLDLERMRNFKRITREDTMTRWSIGRLFYIKINGGIEFYTASGHHPVDVTRTLKIISDHIYGTYLEKYKDDTKLVNN